MKRNSWFLIPMIGLAACGGGSSSNVATPAPEAPETGPTETAFTAFKLLPEQGVVAMEGKAVTASYTADLGTGAVTITEPKAPASSTRRLTMNDGKIDADIIEAEGADFSWDSRRGDTWMGSGGVQFLMSADGSSTATLVDLPEYMSFGTWVNGRGTGAGTIGAGHHGRQTTPSEMPTGVSASYSGVGLGAATLADGKGYETVSSIDLSTDFSTVNLSSYLTDAIDPMTGASNPAPELDFTGSGGVSGSGFSASVSGPGTSGDAEGQFYGPTADAVGGTYRTSGPGGVAHFGAFGAN